MPCRWRFRAAASPEGPAPITAYVALSARSLGNGALGNDGRHAPHARDPRPARADRRRLVARGQVGRHPRCSPTSRERVRLWTRNENDVTRRLARAAPRPPATATCCVDGEVIALNDARAARLRRARRTGCTCAARRTAERKAARAARDLHGLRPAPPRRPRPHPRPLAERRARLLAGLGARRGAGRDLAGARGVRRRRDAASTRPVSRAWRAIVSKRLSSRYEFGAAHAALAEVPAPAPRVVRRRRLAPGDRLGPAGSAALLVGEPTADGLVYRGRVGSGIAGARGPELRALLDAPRPRRTPVRRRGAARRRRRHALGGAACWSSTWSRSGCASQQRLRQPSYRGLRPDLGPEDLT